MTSKLKQREREFLSKTTRKRVTLSQRMEMGLIWDCTGRTTEEQSNTKYPTRSKPKWIVE